MMIVGFFASCTPDLELKNQEHRHTKILQEPVFFNQRAKKGVSLARQKILR